MGIELLGPLRVDGTDAALQRRDQVVLSALAVRQGEVMSADQLADAVWGDAPPASWSKVIQGSVVRLRRALGTHIIETTTNGYRLTASGDELDTNRFEQFVEQGRMLASAGEPERAAIAFGRALALWRGTPLDVLNGWNPGRVAAAHWEELHRSAEERLLDARLDAGEHREVAGIAESQVAAEPLREHRWATLALAQYRSGRQADALRSLRRARATLIEQLGIEPGTELSELEAAILRQDSTLAATPEPPTIAEHCPYKGLAPYDVDDTDAFFGRDAEVAGCLDRLRSHPLLVVTGPSGCGKSSLVRAGIASSLRKANREVAVLVPGNDPEGALASALAACGRSPVVVVDQFEEVFTLDDGGSRAQSFCARLAEYAKTVAPVIVAVRADHVAALAADSQFAELAERGLRLVPPLSGDTLRQAIEGPAALAGIRLEQGLVDLLVRDTEGEPGALPLLSHALAETWRRREGRTLTVEAYRSTGEIRGAVARSADRLYESLPAEQRPKLRSMLLRMVSPSPDGEPVRSRVATRSLGGDADRDRVLGLLVRARLVTAEQDSVELAHEALARAWPRLRSWLDEDAAGQRILRHLATAAEGWESLGRPATELYRGARLDGALEWRESTGPDLTDAERAFLDASVLAAATEREQLAAQARHQARQNRRLRRSLVGVAVLLVAALVGGLVAYQQRQTAVDERRTAETEERESALTALTGNASALRTNRRDLAALLAIEAHRLSPSAATQSAMFGAFTASPNLLRSIQTDVQLEWVEGQSAYVPNSDLLVVNDEHASLAVVDLERGDVIRLEGLNDAGGPAALAVAGGGRFAAVALGEFSGSAWDSATFTVWDLENNVRRFDPVRIPFSVATARTVITEDGSLVALGDGESGEVEIFDGRTGSRVAVLDPLPPIEEAQQWGNPVALRFHPDGTLLVGTHAGPIRVVDPETGDEIRRIDAPPSTGDDFLALRDEDNTLIAVGLAERLADGYGNTSTIRGFDVRTGDLLWTAPQPITKRTCNAFVYAERIDALLCGEWSGRVVAYDVSTGSEISDLFDSQLGDVCGLAVSPDGRRLAAVSSCIHDEATILEWALDGAGAISELVIDSNGPRFVVRYGFSGDDDALVVEAPTDSTDEPITQILAPTSHDVIEELPGLYGLFPTGDPRIALAYVVADDAIRLFDVEAREPTGPTIDSGLSGGFEEVHGDRVLVAGWEGAASTTYVVRPVDPSTGELGEPIFESDVAYVLQMRLTDETLYMITFEKATHDFRLERWDADSGEVLARSDVGMASVAVGGDVVVAGTTDGRIFELDPATLKPIGRPFPGFTGPIDRIVMDESGERLLVRGVDMTIRFYDVATRTQLGDKIDLGSPFPESGAALRGDGLEAAAVTGQGIVVWDLDPAHWVDAACQVAGRNLTHAEWDQYIGDLGPYRRTCPQFPEG